MSSKKTPLFILSAPSGTGKNTLINNILEICPNLRHSISTTTRPPRNGETHGVEYYFISHDKFFSLIEEKKFLEYKKVLGNYYGTTIDEIKRIRNDHKIPILDIDVQGLLELKKNCNEIVSIFITPPSLEVLRERLRKRSTETTTEIERRIELARQELSYQQIYQHTIVNDVLETAVLQLKEIIQVSIDSFNNVK